MVRWRSPSFLVALAVGVLAVTALADRIDLPAPLVLIAAGVAISYVPGMPEVHLEPEVVLLGLLPPLLYATAIQTSLVDFNANRRSILPALDRPGRLHHRRHRRCSCTRRCPGVAWPAAFAIGAVVAPPDAVAATAIGRRIGLPRRIVTILEGESLLNDATALVALRTAIAGGRHGIAAWRVGLDFVLGRRRRRADRVRALLGRGLGAPPHQRPAARHRDLVRGAVRGLHRWPRRRTPPA